MTQIRKNTITSSIWIYIGFLVGAINVYLFTHDKWFTPDEYGLTTTMRELSLLFAAMSSLGTTTYLVKLFPYYQSRLPLHQNDILGQAIKISFAGFVVVAAFLVFLQPLVLRVFSQNAQLLVEYFYWCIPFTLFALLFTLLESYSLGHHKGILVNFLKEFAIRVYVSVLLVLKIFNVINFDWFIGLLSFQFLFICLILIVWLRRQNKISFVFKTSFATRKYRKIINKMVLFSAVVVIVSVFRAAIDNILISSLLGLKQAAVSSFSSYLNALLQAPYRSILSVTAPLLAIAWKTKNITEIDRIYKRSSINLLSFALFIFFLVYMNYDRAIEMLHLNEAYLTGKPIFLILGIMSIIELGTGVSSYILGTSTYWSLLLWSNLVLTFLLMPLGYILISHYGIIGPSLANLITFFLYNTFFYFFLLVKYKLQPFSSKTVEVILFALLLFFVLRYTNVLQNNLFAIIVNVIVYTVGFALFMYFRKISPDLSHYADKLLRRKK